MAGASKSRHAFILGLLTAEAQLRCRAASDIAAARITGAKRRTVGLQQGVNKFAIADEDLALATVPERKDIDREGRALSENLVVEVQKIEDTLRKAKVAISDVLRSGGAASTRCSRRSG